MFRQELEDLKDRHIGRFTLLNVLSRNEESSAPLFEGRITADKVAGVRLDAVQAGRGGARLSVRAGLDDQEARNALLELGVPREKVHHEFFAAGGGAYRAKSPSPRTSRGEGRGEGQPHAPEQASAPHLTLSPRKSGEREPVGTEAIAVLDGIRHRFTVPPGGHVVDAALAAGIRVPYSCKGGMCCTCRARLVEGKAEMTTNYSLEPWEIERGFILTCQAVPQVGAAGGGLRPDVGEWGRRNGVRPSRGPQSSSLR